VISPGTSKIKLIGAALHGQGDATWWESVE
jgi:hypothetical protein